MQFWSLGREDPLEEEMKTHSSILVWKMPWTEEPGGFHTVHGVTKSQTWLSDWAHNSAPPSPSADLLPSIQCSESLEGQTFLPCPPQMPVCHRVAFRDSALCFRHDDLVRFSYSTYTGHITLQVHEFTQVHGARNRMFKTKMIWALHR